MFNFSFNLDNGQGKRPKHVAKHDIIAKFNDLNNAVCHHKQINKYNYIILPSQ